MEREAFKYTVNYCEENIWHLCQHPELHDFDKKVLIVSNSAKNCPFYSQKSGQDEQAVWWDYHVIMLASKDGSNMVYDFDSRLNFPCELTDYLERTFLNHPYWLEKDLPQFKAIEANTYTKAFFSDRSHMKDLHGNWIFSPPAWPIIEGKGKLILNDLMDFSQNSHQRIFSLEEMHLFAQKPGFLLK